MEGGELERKRVQVRDRGRYWRERGREGLTGIGAKRDEESMRK